MVKVSVILPNYNHAQYLKKRIDSILYQSFQDFEVIIIDDNSTDNSQSILEAYKNNPKVSHLIFNKKNSGTPFGNWKKGFDLAQGQYIWIAESDDWADELFLEKTVKKLEEYPQAGIAYTDSTIVNGKGVHTGTWKALKNERFCTEKWSQDYVREGTTELVENMLLVMTINNMSACLLRKSALPEMSKIVALKGAGDWLLCGLILLKHGLVYCAEPLNHYRTHAENVTKANDKSGLLLIENMKFYSIILNELKAKKIDWSEVEFDILDRYLFKYTSLERVSFEKKGVIRKLMLSISLRFYLKFMWMLLKYRVKKSKIN
jgi:glycosyltransferase involved in cell wall biosynthesis